MSSISADDILDNEFEQETDLECSLFLEDLQYLAKCYIDIFFANKLDRNGKVLSKEILHSDEHVSLVLNTDICSGMDAIYEIVGIDYAPEEMRVFERQGQLPDDVKYVVSLLYETSLSYGIPKCFKTGIILMYLELCSPWHGGGHANKRS